MGEEFGFPLTVGITTRLNIKMQGLERTVADLQVVPTAIDSGPAFIATLRDVSELVRAEEGERLKAKELETLARIGNIRCKIVRSASNAPRHWKCLRK